MPVFAYKATDGSSPAISGTIVANTPRAARDILRQRGLLVQHITAHQVNAKPTLLRRRLARRHGTKTISFIRELATLLGVGIPLLEAIDTIARQYKGPFHATLLQLRERIAAGISLADAMREQPLVFDEFCVNIAEVGENAGTLDTVLERLAEFKERAQSLKDRVLTALLYPCIVLTMATGVSIFLMTFLVPQLLRSIEETGQEIPLVTRMVKAVSDFLLYRWWMLLLIVVVVVTLISLILRSAKGRLTWHRVLLRLPIIGEMARKQSVVRISIVISTLMRNGIVFLRAVQIAQKTTRNLVIRGALERCETAVTSGQDIGKALEDTGAFNPLVVQIFSIGQQSGRLEEMLERLAADYDRQLTVASQRLTAVLEPVLILLMVLIVGFIAFATILPMLEAANVV